MSLAGSIPLKRLWASLWASFPVVTPLAWGIGISFFLHGVVLTLHFKFPEASSAMREKALDIILVNAKSAQKPKDAQALAQANLDGGGNTCLLYTSDAADE